MATYIEKYDIAFPSGSVSDLYKKVTIAVANNASTIAAGVPGDFTRQEWVWAFNALANIQAVANQFLMGVLNDATILSNGNSSTDQQVQDAVDAIVGDFLLP